MRDSLHRARILACLCFVTFVLGIGFLACSPPPSCSDNPARCNPDEEKPASKADGAKNQGEGASTGEKASGQEDSGKEATKGEGGQTSGDESNSKEGVADGGEGFGAEGADGGENTEGCEGNEQECWEPPYIPPSGQYFPPGTTDVQPDQPLTGDKYDVKAKAKMDAGPFGKVDVEGRIKKDGKDAPVTWCFKGKVSLSGAPFKLTGAEITLCKDDQGAITRTFAGTLELDGETATVTGDVEVGSNPSLKMKAKSLKLLGLNATDVELSWKQGEQDVTVDTGKASLTYLQQTIAATLSGYITPNGDSNLDLKVTSTEAAKVKTVGGVVGAQAESIQGKRVRQSGDISTTLSLEASNPTLQNMTTKLWKVEATKEQSKSWELDLEAKDSDVTPFQSLQLKGQFVENDKEACVSGLTGVKEPETGQEIQVKVCWGGGKPTAPEFIAKASDPTLGDFELKGSYDSKSGRLCLQGALSGGVTVDGKASTVQVSTCYNTGSQAFGALSYQADVDIAGHGKATLQGTTTTTQGGPKSLCLSSALQAGTSKWLPLQGATVLAVQAQSCLSNKSFPGAALLYTYRIGTAGAQTSVVLQSEITLGAGSGLCIASPTSSDDCDKANRQWHKTLLDPRDKLTQRFVWLNGICLDSQATTSSQCGSTGVSNLTATWKSSGSWHAKVQAAPFCKKKGSTSCAWAASCNTNAGDTTCSQSWKPYDTLPIGASYDLRMATLGNMQGAVWVHNGKASLRLNAEVTSPLTDGKAHIVVENKTNLFSLKQPGIRGDLSEGGLWNTTITGNADLNLTGQSMAPWKIQAKLEGTVGSKTMSFSGVLLPGACNKSTHSCTWPEVEPFAAIIGKGNFKVSGKDGTLAIVAPYSTSRDEDFRVNLVSWGEVNLPGNKPTQTEALVQALWKRKAGGDLNTTPAVTFALAIGKQRLKAGNFTIQLGEATVGGSGPKTYPTYLLASSESAEMPVDLDGKASNGKETLWEVVQGVTIRSSANLPHIANMFKNVLAKLDITWTTTKFKLDAELDFNWILIKPSYGVPSINKAVFDKVFAQMSFPGTVRVFIGGKVDFEMFDRAGKINKVEGLAQFEADGKGGAGGTIALSGLWRNPFWIPNVALFNAGISMKLNPAVPTMPSALGFTGQSLIHKGNLDAAWPTIVASPLNNPVGVNPDGSQMKKLPDNIFTSGFTFYYDLVPKKSDFCYNFCKIPPLLFRIDLQNIGTDDIVKFANLMMSGLKRLVKESATVSYPDPAQGKVVTTTSPWAPLTQSLPLDKIFKPVSIKPFSMTLDRFQIYMSTHSQERFNVDWPAGFKLAAEAKFTPPAGPDKGKTKQVKLRGHLDIWGINLRGSMTAIQLLPGLNLTGDPFRRIAEIGTGYLQFNTQKQDWNWGTFEGWFQDNQIEGGSNRAVLYQRGDSNTGGMEIATNELAPACTPGAIHLDGSPRDCTTPRGKVVVTMWGLEASAGINGPQLTKVTRVIKTKYGVLLPQQMHHIAVTIDPTTKRIKIFVDGVQVSILDTADGPDGEYGTIDDLTRFALPTTTDKVTYIGQRFTYVDDVRLWKTVRTPGELERHTTSLNKGFQTDSNLIARWEFDYDRSSDKNSNGVIVRNSKLNASSAYHGAYKLGAKVAIDSNNQDLKFKLKYPLLNTFHSGWAIRAGLDLKLPQAVLNLSGNPKGITVAADLSYLPGAIGGKLYTRELTIVPIPTVGGFVITGNGPNGIANDFDDGLYMEGEFRAPSNTNNLGDDKLPVFDATGAFALDWNGKRHPIVTATMRLGCLIKNSQGEGVFSGKSCSLGNGYHIWSKAYLGKKGSISVDLGGGAGQLGINGIFSLSTLDAPVKLLIDGSLKVFGRDIVGAQLYADGKGILATSSFDVGVQHGVNLGIAQQVTIQFDWKPARLCAQGNTDLAVPAVATFKGSVGVCLGNNPSASFTGKASAGKFGGVPVTDLEVRLDSSKGLEITKARLKVGPIFDGDVKGYYKTTSNFNLTGMVTMSPGGGQIMKLESTTNVQPSGVTHSTKLDSSKSGNWVSGSISGATRWSGSTPKWALVGNATLKPSGLNLVSSRFWICNAWSTTSSSVPAECRSNSGFGGKGTLDLKVVKMSVSVIPNSAVTDYAVSGSASFRWKMGGFLHTWFETVYKEVANKLSGWSCSSFCKNRTGGVCVLHWFRCKRDEKRTQTEQVESDVTFTLTGSKSGVKLSASATLKVGRWSGSSSTTCSVGSKPECCFSFVSPIGKQCLKLY